MQHISGNLTHQGKPELCLLGLRFWLNDHSLRLPNFNPLLVRIPGTTAFLKFSEFHEILDASTLSSLLIEDLHKILLKIIQGGRGDRLVDADYITRARRIHIHINNHAGGQGLTYGEVANMLAGIGVMAKSMEPRDSMFEYWEDDDDQPVTYGYLSI